MNLIADLTINLSQNEKENNLSNVLIYHHWYDKHSESIGSKH